MFSLIEVQVFIAMQIITGINQHILKNKFQQNNCGKNEVFGHSNSVYVQSNRGEGFMQKVRRIDVRFHPHQTPVSPTFRCR